MSNMLAVCHDCGVQHGLTLESMLTTNAVRDWECKHRGHVIEFLSGAAYGVSVSRHAVGEYRHNADVKLALAADSDYTCTLASLATSANLTAGRESTSVSNTANLYLDYMVSGQVTTGTSPTANTSIQVLAIGSQDDTPTWPDVFDGTDSAETITSVDVKNALARYVAAINVDNTSDVTYYFGPVSLANLFGVLPSHHVLFVTHDTAVNLNSTGSNHVLTYQGVYATVT